MKLSDIEQEAKNRMGDEVSLSLQAFIIYSIRLAYRLGRLDRTQEVLNDAASRARAAARGAANTLAALRNGSADAPTASAEDRSAPPSEL